MPFISAPKALADKRFKKIMKKAGLTGRALKVPGKTWVQRRPGAGIPSGARRIDIALAKPLKAQ
jgi:hypothetical protein